MFETNAAAAGEPRQQPSNYTIWLLLIRFFTNIINALKKYNKSINIQHCVSDEIRRYLDARYVSASESCWRIFGFSLHSEWPNTVRLQVHLPNQQMTYFADDANVEDIVQAGPRNTTLTAWFAANLACADGRHLMYNEFPKHYTWNKRTCAWVPRVRGETATIGRLYMVSPNQGERFYLRLLLHNVAGATSFEHLRTVDGHEWGTFREAASALGLVQGDNEWRQSLTEAAVMQTGKQLRHLFAVILLFGNPVAPEALFEEFQDDLCDDILREHEQRATLQGEIVNEALLHIDSILRDSGKLFVFCFEHVHCVVCYCLMKATFTMNDVFLFVVLQAGRCPTFPTCRSHKHGDSPLLPTGTSLRSWPTKWTRTI